MKQILKLLVVSFSVFSVFSCKKDGKTRGEGERRINESEITIYSNKDLSDLKVGDFIYVDYTQKSIDDHKGFFDYYYSPIVKELISGLNRINCQDIFPEKKQCYQITNKDFEFSYTMSGSYSCTGGFITQCSAQPFDSELKTYKSSIKSDLEELPSDMTN